MKKKEFTVKVFDKDGQEIHSQRVSGYHSQLANEYTFIVATSGFSKEQQDFLHHVLDGISELKSWGKISER